MRILDTMTRIDYVKTKRFFKRRANKYNCDNPYSVTMYQDDHPELVAQRNQYEITKLTGLLQIDQNCTVLDLACGIGRWADAFHGKIKSYLGIDFSEDLIRIALQRNPDPCFAFKVGAMTSIDQLLSEGELYNRILMIGILMYLNDGDIISMLDQVILHCEKETLICIREPIGLNSRLTLKDFYSEELKDNYNAIYRTREELIKLITPTLLKNGFSIRSEGFLFDDDALNNRKETAQYYFILIR